MVPAWVMGVYDERHTMAEDGFNSLRILFFPREFKSGAIGMACHSVLIRTDVVFQISVL